MDTQPFRVRHTPPGQHAFSLDYLGQKPVGMFGESYFDLNDIVMFVNWLVYNELLTATEFGVVRV